MVVTEESHEALQTHAFKPFFFELKCYNGPGLTKDDSTPTKYHTSVNFNFPVVQADPCESQFI